EEDWGNYSSRCTLPGENAGRQTAIYSAPPGSGVEYWIHSPGLVMTACPACTLRLPPLCRTRSTPSNTTVNSTNSGVCPGSTQPSGLRMCATLAAEVPLFTRPTYSSMIFGLFPAASIRVGCAIRVGIEKL